MKTTNEQLINFLQDIYEYGGEGEMNLEKYSKEAIQEAKDTSLIDFNNEIASGQTILLTVKGKNLLLQHMDSSTM